MRWNSDKTAMISVLTETEAEQIVNDVIKNLDDVGYIIIKK